VASFRQGLKEVGYIDGQNVSIEFRWAQGQYDRMFESATDLVRRQVAVIFASAPPGIAKAATTTSPSSLRMVVIQSSKASLQALTGQPVMLLARTS
jgi:hypothetical protein